MNLDQLSTFIHVARLGSFAAVARSQGVDPSVVSRIISTLESALGFRLFQRTTRTLALTEAGQTYLTRIAPLVDELLLAHEDAQAVTQQITGHLRITCSVSFGQVCVVPLLAAFRQRYPQIKLELLLTDALVDLVAERVDVALRLAPHFDSGYVGQILRPTQYRVVASPHYLATHQHPQHPNELSEHGCAVFPLQHYRTHWHFRLRNSVDSADVDEQITPLLDVPIQDSIIISNALALRQVALDGLAPALLADWLVDEDIRTGRLVHVLPEYDVTATDFATAVWLLYPSRQYVPLKVRLFMDYLKEQLAPNL